MPRFRLSRAARSDIVEILVWSEEHFGVAASQRYLALLRAAVEDLAADPLRRGSTSRPELGDGVRSWHVRLSRQRSGEGIVRSARHFLIYRVEGDVVVIGRVLHDAMELRQHVDPEHPWQ